MNPTDLTLHEITCPHCQKRLAYVPPIGRFELTHGPADAQALADVRTLDEWAEANRWRGVALHLGHDSGDYAGYQCCVGVEGVSYGTRFFGPTPDAARHAAAEWVRGQK